MINELEKLSLRIGKLEEQRNQDVLALVEILSNAIFFGELKKAHCQYAINGQCTLFVLDKSVKNKIPIVSECRIKQCVAAPIKHYHIEPSNITCTLCKQTNSEMIASPSVFSPHNTSKKNNMEPFSEIKGE